MNPNRSYDIGDDQTQFRNFRFKIFIRIMRLQSHILPQDSLELIPFSGMVQLRQTISSKSLPPTPKWGRIGFHYRFIGLNFDRILGADFFRAMCVRPPLGVAQFELEKSFLSHYQGFRLAGCPGYESGCPGGSGTR
ncbi:hypothetical protein CEXT_294611 [Caerostris extrusa]|uniref:Uncharacterized protein n=1 Tax=Caerostris extrusa TaxID=172846 RepID=A0AAV4RU17_CAEEX|nr:hypothetical protein CEXT_294611 [Caerostris extrusa]